MNAPSPFDAPAGGPAPTRRVVRAEHRQRPLRAGIVCVVLGLGLIIGGAVMFSVVQATQVLASIADADMGETITFEAESKSYSLILIRGEINDENVVDRLVANTTCTVTASDGTTRSVDGSSQFDSTQTDFGASIGSFDVPSGTTEVRCVGEGSRNIFDRYAVAPERLAAKIVAYVLIGLGFVLGLVGIWLIKIGWRGKTVVERVPA